MLCRLIAGFLSFFIAFLDRHAILTFDYIFYAIPFPPQIINSSFKMSNWAEKSAVAVTVPFFALFYKIRTICS